MAVTLEEPQKSPLDKKIYRRLKLGNGLDVLLIHDPEMEGAEAQHAVCKAAEHEEADGSDGCEHSGGEEKCTDTESEDEGEDAEDGGEKIEKARTHVKKAAAAMAVGVGSFSDPEDVQGMSHYLEHMLFMGSERFPDENDYDAYLQRHGGSANAFTEMEYTNYHFDCKPDALRGGLERFSQFFIAPLCKADALGREVNAVDNEFSGVQQDDSSRLAQLRCHTARAGHMYRKFTWGNRESLVSRPAERGVDVRTALLDYYRQQYSAERMCLAVLGGQPLDTLQTWVAELFSSVPFGRGPRPAFSHAGPPYEGGRLHVLPAVRQGHALTVTFQLPSLFEQYAAKPEDYISHLVGHEGAGSLLSLLKAKGWATAISAGVGDTGYERNSAVFIFEVTITLTEAGLHAVPGYGLATVGPLFEYLRLLRGAGPQRWVFDELAAIAALRFRFAEDEDACELVARLAADMPLYAPAHALRGPHLYEQWRPDLVSDLLLRMTPDAARLDLQTSSFADLLEKHELAALPGAVRSTEPWFDLPYACMQLPTEQLRAWEQPVQALAAQLALPPSNHYVPTDFHLHGNASADEPRSNEALAAEIAAKALCAGVPNGAACYMDNGHANGHEQQDGQLEMLTEPPSMIVDAPGLRMWHKLDRTFRLPKAVAYFSVTSRAAYESAHAAAAMHLALKLAEDALCETAYLADVAGLSYDVWPEGLCGVEFKVEGFSHKLPLLVASIVRQLVHLQVDAQRFHLVREALALKYANANMSPSRHASYLRLLALKHMWHVDDALAELRRLTPSALQEFLPRLYKDAHIECLIQGNVRLEDALDIAQKARAEFSDGFLTAAERPLDAVTRLSPGCSLLHRAGVKNGEEDNSVAEVYLQAGPDAPRLRAQLDLLEQVMAEPVYDTLRTKEQLGYSVHCSTRLTHGVLGFALVVVSGAHGPAHLDARIDAFLGAFEGALRRLSPDELEGHRAALVASKTLKDASLADEADRNWEQVSNKRYNFLAREQEVACLRELTLEELQRTYAEYFLPSSPQRRKLAVHVVGKSQAGELASSVPPGVQLAEDLPALQGRLGAFPAVPGTPPPVATVQG